MVTDGSFEQPAVGNSYVYNPTVAGASFVAATGAAGNGSGWEFLMAPDGTQAAFVQGSGTATTSAITLAVSPLGVGSWYKVSFQLARRSSFAPNPVEVRIGTNLLSTYTATSTSWTPFVTATFQATGASTTLEFRTTSNDPYVVAGVDKIVPGP